MKYTERLNLPCDWSDFLKTGPVLGRHGSGGPYPIERVIRRYLPRKQIAMIADVLPESLKDKLMGVNYSEIRILGPHVHLKEKAVINFYQSTGDEVTTFWDGEIVRDDRWSLDNGNGYNHVNHELLHEVESFVAKAGDVRLLNSAQPHSVTYLNDDRTDGYQFLPRNDDARLIIQAYFDIPYSEVYEALKQAGMIIESES